MGQPAAQLAADPWSFACPDWEARLKAGRSILPALPLDQAAADRAVGVFDRLRLPDVPGTPPLAEAGADWFRDIVRALFGSIDPVTAERRVRELFVLVSKKNAKTTNGALLMLTALLLNIRPRAKFILTGPTHDVAQLAYSQVSGAIALDPVLSQMLHVRDHLKLIQHRNTGAELEIMTFDPSVLTGQKPAGILIDELHVSARMARAGSAIRQLRGGMLPIPEAFLVFITTQSEEPPVGVFRAELMKARKIRDGIEHNAPMLPVLYEFPEAMQRDRTQWGNPKNWPMVVPNAGRSVSINRLAADMRVAESTGEDELRAWASQHLNVEIGIALRSDGWAGAQFWKRGAEPGLTLEAIIERSEIIVVGGDGGGTDDLLGVAVLGRERDTRRWLHWAHAMVTPDGMERRKANLQIYEDLAAAGDLTIADDETGDLTEMVDVVRRIKAADKFGGFGVDAAGSGMVIDALGDIGVSDAEKNLIGIKQGMGLMGPIKTLERRIRDGSFRHCDQPLMSWCVANAVVEITPTAMRIARHSSGFGKIDPLMATFNAVALMEREPGMNVIEQGFIAL